MQQILEIRWPDHWYHHDQVHIRCIVPGCGAVSSSQDKEQQWEELCNHARTTPGTEHSLLHIMLQQTICAFTPCGLSPPPNSSGSYGLRILFQHERAFHGTELMSCLSSFVRFAREGRVRQAIPGGPGTEPKPECEKLTYDHMMDKIQALPEEHLHMLYRKNGFNDADERTTHHLSRILLHDPSSTNPFGWPVKVDNFLLHCHTDPLNPADNDWATLWTNLRARYAAGDI